MKDIAGAAILFDMYYMAKDPVLLNGEKEEDIKAITYPVTEETPQFRDFHISNVVCNGADKAIFVRGLPEMNIKNISVENSVFQADQGIEIIEGSNINLKNVSIEIKKKQPVIVINNGTDLVLDNIAVANIENRKLFEVSGDKTKRVKINGKDAVK